MQPSSADVELAKPRKVISILNFFDYITCWYKNAVIQCNQPPKTLVFMSSFIPLSRTIPCSNEILIRRYSS